MRALAARRIILPMTPRPHTVSKVVLITDSRDAAPGSADRSIRRFRLARLRFDGRELEPPARYDHLKRAFD